MSREPQVRWPVADAHEVGVLVRYGFGFVLGGAGIQRIAAAFVVARKLAPFGEFFVVQRADGVDVAVRHEQQVLFDR